MVLLPLIIIIFAIYLTQSVSAFSMEAQSDCDVKLSDTLREHFGDIVLTCYTLFLSV